MNDNSIAAPHPKTTEDRRLYLLDADWSVAVNRGSVSQYCHSQNVGEAFFHLIVDGEIFLKNGAEKLCLSCALRLGLITSDRLAWQHRTGTRTSHL
jgi:hypothetical protein